MLAANSNFIAQASSALSLSSSSAKDLPHIRHNFLLNADYFFLYFLLLKVVEETMRVSDVGHASSNGDEGLQ